MSSTHTPCKSNPAASSPASGTITSKCQLWKTAGEIKSTHRHSLSLTSWKNHTPSWFCPYSMFMKQDPTRLTVHLLTLARCFYSQHSHTNDRYHRPQCHAQCLIRVKHQDWSVQTWWLNPPLPLQNHLHRHCCQHWYFLHHTPGLYITTGRAFCIGTSAEGLQRLEIQDVDYVAFDILYRKNILYIVIFMYIII